MISLNARSDGITVPTFSSLRRDRTEASILQDRDDELKLDDESIRLKDLDDESIKLLVDRDDESMK